MILWTAAATAAAMILFILFLLYRRQVKTACRQLAFLKSHQTNLRLTASLPCRELNELTDQINELIDRSRQISLDSRKRETDLKETIANLSHDIRTPLTSMDGYFQLLLESGSEEERNHYISVIQTRIESLKNMLEELFTYTRLQDTDYKLETEEMDFGKCVCSTVFSFYDDFQKKGIEPSADFCSGHLMINGNEEAVRRTLQNLIRNALVHGQSQISLSLFCRGGRAGFRCSNDTEHPEEIDISQIFSRFYKADAARTHTSAGLGLSIAKGLTERMGGSISAALEDNLFTVEILFPLK